MSPEEKIVLRNIMDNTIHADHLSREQLIHKLAIIRVFLAGLIDEDVVEITPIYMELTHGHENS